MMKYKEYVAETWIDAEAGVIRGRVINTRDIITFYGVSVPEAEAAFRSTVDEYLEFSKEIGAPPEKPFSGRFVVRLTPELHRKISIEAQRRGKSVNKLVFRLLERDTRKLAASPVRLPGSSKASSGVRTALATPPLAAAAIRKTHKPGEAVVKPSRKIESAATPAQPKSRRRIRTTK